MSASSHELNTFLQVVKEPFVSHQFTVAARLHNLAFFENVNHIRVLYCLDTVSDAQSSLICHYPVQRLLHFLLVFGIQC
jgi:hypothetical protein